MTIDPSLLAEATTLVIESLASAVEAAVVAEDEGLLLSKYKDLRYTARILCDTLKPYTQTSEEDGREVVEQYGTSTNAGGVR